MLSLHRMRLRVVRSRVVVRPQYDVLTCLLSCEGHVLFRGHFNATGSETAANLTIYGGFCASLLASIASLS